jgi:hypothetical protein
MTLRMPETPAGRLLRAAGLGLSLGLGAAGCALAGWAFFTIQVDCSTLSPTECEFAQQTARTIARLQGLGSFGLVLVSFGIWIFVKKSTPRNAPKTSSETP